MTTPPPDVLSAFSDILHEVLEGQRGHDAWLLNRGDRGLLASLDGLSADEASAIQASGSSIASHAEHLRYGFSLMNRWMAGDNPFQEADWASAWRHPRVSDAEWAHLRDALAREGRQWLAAVHAPARWDDLTIKGIVASIAHLAYHLGAIRQMHAGTAGPRQAL